MLQLRDIKKDYKVGEQTIPVLHGITLDLPDKGLVSILGQSGCGKTTLMNIIGGLDRATSGEIVINGVSTQGYSEADYNAYRNEKVGFVFQTYNLIPHMTVLQNVEVALTVAGVGPEERKRRSLAILEKVGLLGQTKKRPNQLSGGQCQRVAIARALVNDPTIILADEPTGAIDSETSYVIMDLLKEISKNCLVVMVTHNPDLADRYSDRIIHMRDGMIIQDNESFNRPKTSFLRLSYRNDNRAILESNRALQEPKQEVSEPETPAVANDKKKKKNRSKMTFSTAIKLSLSNLVNKKGRSAMTVIAGSIGIICIFLILAMNLGFSNYIKKYETQSLNLYPIKVYSASNSFMDLIQKFFKGKNLSSEDAIDMNTLFDIFREDEGLREKYTDEEIVYLAEVFLSLVEGDKSLNAIKTSTDLSMFYEYFEENFDPSWATVRNDYEYQLNIHTDTPARIRLNPIYNMLIRTAETIWSLGDTVRTVLKSTLDSLKIWTMMVDDKDVLQAQYDLLAGEWPDYTDEEEGIYNVVVVVDQYNQLDDATLVFMNLLPYSEVLTRVVGGTTQSLQREFSFDEILGLTFSLMVPTDYYSLDTRSHLYDYSEDSATVRENCCTIRVSGIVRLKEGLSAGCIDGTIAYTSALGNWLIDQANESDLIKDLEAEYEEYQQLMEEVEIIKNKQKADPEYELTDEEQLLMIQVSIPGFGIKNVCSDGKEYLSEQDYRQLLFDLGARKMDDPKAMYFYPTSLENKEKIIAMVNAYNESIANDEEIQSSSVDYSASYVDDLSAITASMKSTVDTITYVLIAVAVVAVIVTMFLVAIILYISVQDRTKEIGILRSIGASRLNVGNVFLAETFIIGLVSGIIGVLLGLVLLFPVNAIVESTLGIKNLLQPSWWQSLLLILFSFITTAVSGLIPSVLATKKDPVIALRTE